MSRPTDLQRVDSFQYPKGHIGHLGDGQLKTLQEFKKLCQDKGYYNPGDPAAGVPPSHDDETMLRYLRARKFVPNEAYSQFKDTEDWRKKNDIDNLYETIDVHEYESSRRLYPQWTGRRDKRGIPFFVYEVGSLNYKDIAANANDKGRSKDGPATVSKEPPRLLRLFALYENLCRFSLPISSTVADRPNPETPISQSNNIVDISHVGLTTFWNLKNHMQDASKLATAHYPETLDRIFIVGAPSFFPTVWGWIKKWFDPITVSKIFILTPTTTLPTLEKYLDKSTIPKKYGGDLDWNFGDLPSIDPAIADKFTWHEDIKKNGYRTIPIGPIRFEHNDEGDLVLVAVGTENGKQRHLKLGTLRPDANVALLDIGINRRKGGRMAAAVAGTGSAEPTLPAGGTEDVPYHNPAARTGTSTTKFEQQEGTHAESQVAHGTPELRTDGQGTTQSITEPRTIGQSAKETPLVDDTEPKPTLTEQAQHAVEQVQHIAVESATAALQAVGLAEKKAGEIVEKAEEAVGKHPAEGLENHQVEEYIRSTVMSGPEKVKNVDQK